MTDVEVLDDSELEDLRLAVIAEQRKRQAIRDAPEQANEVAQRYADATGMVPGAPWVQPIGTIGAYPLPWTVTHIGKEWENLIPANVQEPGDPDDPQSYRWWKDLTEPPEPPDGQPPAWDGNGHVYATGDEVSFGDRKYSCIQGHTSQPTWTPTTVPALWRDDGPLE